MASCAQWASVSAVEAITHTHTHTTRLPFPCPKRVMLSYAVRQWICPTMCNQTQLLPSGTSEGVSPTPGTESTSPSSDAPATGYVCMVCSFVSAVLSYFFSRFETIFDILFSPPPIIISPFSNFSWPAQVNKSEIEYVR